MEFGLLGPLEVRAGEGPLPLGAPKQRALLALLLLNANRVVARGRLIDELWGEEPPETAAKAVQVYVSRLRKLLPAGMLVTRPPGYLLKVEPEAVDLWRFERLVAEAREGEPAAAATLLRQALALWRGPPLAEFAEEPFARVEAGRLQDLRLAALEERIEADLALGRHADLVGELETLIAEHPQRERLRGQLMLALYRSGRQAEALAAYRNARAALDELGLEPGVALRQLEKQILTQDAALELARVRPPPSHVALPGALVPASPFPFVGRERELAALRSLLERSEQGEGGLVLLAGEAGGGKTRLIREFAHEAAAGGVLVLYGTSDATVSVPYQPLREWLDFLLRTCDPDLLTECLADRGQILARLVPELAHLTGAPEPPSGDIASDRYLLQSAAVDLLSRVSRIQPLLVVSDDLHWADAETLHLLRRLARTAPETPLLVLAAYRSEEIGPMLSDTLADLARLDGVARLGVGRLTEDEMAEFIRASTEADATAGFVSAIRELTDGIPLLLCELWRDARESGAVEVSDAGVSLARPTAELRGPARIRDILRQRLSRLAPETTALIELAAVTGPQFDLRVLAQATALDQGALVAAVEEAVDVGIVEELPEPTPAGRFTHELMRRAVYDRITGIRRAELHLRVGEALERLHQDDLTRVLPELAHHFTLAAPVAGVDRAVDYNLRAGDAAIATAAYEEAAARLSSALELGIADPRERARVQIELSTDLHEIGRVEEAEAILGEGLETGTGLDERGIVARALVDRASREFFADPEFDPKTVEPVVSAAIETFARLADPSGLARAERLRGIALRDQGRGAEGTDVLERALVHADASGDRRTLRLVVTTLGSLLCTGPTPVSAAIRRCTNLLETYGGDRVLEGVITRFLSVFFAMAGRFDEARELVQRSSLILDELQLLTPSWVFRRYAAEARQLLGDLAGAEHELRAMWESLRDLQEADPDWRAMNAADKLALIYCDQGRWEDAAAELSYGRDVPESTSNHLESVLRLAVRARLAAHRGELAEGVAIAERAVRRVEASDLLNLSAGVWLALAEVQRAAGAVAAADAAVAEAIRLYEQKGNVAAVAQLRAATPT
jgi:DNA-binding SARP family transcriptional activator